MNLYQDSQATDAARRQLLYDGSIFIYSPCQSALKLCQLAKDMVEEAFHPLDPLLLHESLPVEKCVETLAALKPKFIHHPEAKECLRGILTELGCDLDKTYFDVPRMRTAFPGDYLKSGIAYAFHPHRDIWYSAPLCQINWWMPFFPFNAENSMAFHPRYWDVPLKNSSVNYNYAKWNQESRHNAAQHIKADTRVQPKPEESVELDPQVRVICDVGGIYLFSAAHLHSTVPNTSGKIRYSIDFRTVHLDDVLNRKGAPNIDSACTGTTMNDYMRAADLARVPADAVALYEDGLPWPA
ncbi:MAG: hypothetical protein PVS2B2_16100 [Candidatus Acidiferrum sp.]